MLLHLVAVSLVMMACASETLEATFNCSTAAEEIYGCLRKPEQNKTYKQFIGHRNLYNMPKVTTILKRLKTSGCIKASEWTNVQAWIKIHTPPKAYIAIYKNLSKTQKKIIRPGVFYTKEQTEKARAVFDVINGKSYSFSDADRKKFDEWFDEYAEACLG